MSIKKITHQEGHDLKYDGNAIDPNSHLSVRHPAVMTLLIR